jgi:ubiquinone/menaquinone biosynthesis C-methylase UbiE
MKDDFAHKAPEWDTPDKIKMTTTFVSEMWKNITPDKNWKALEIGSGTGLVGLQVLPLIDSIVFEDTSEAMVGVLKQKLNGKENAEILHGEVFDYEPKDIDLIFSSMAFHHLPDIDKTLNHLAKITNPNATIVVGDLKSEDGSFHGFEPIPHKGFDTEELSTQFENAGFQVKKVYTYNILKRERIPGQVNIYEQFILVAVKN